MALPVGTSIDLPTGNMEVFSFNFNWPEYILDLSNKTKSKVNTPKKIEVNLVLWFWILDNLWFLHMQNNKFEYSWTINRNYYSNLCHLYRHIYSTLATWEAGCKYITASIILLIMAFFLQVIHNIKLQTTKYFRYSAKRKKILG